MESEKRDSFKFVKLLLFLFVLFLIMYISNKNGYYEYKTYTKAHLTEQRIKEFENDVNNGKDVSINDYVVNEYKDYSNIVSKTGSKINKVLETFMNSGIKKTLKVLSRLFYE